MYLGTINATDYYHINSYKKELIIEIAENKVEFVTHEDFDALVDKEHYRAEYLTYCNSMNVWWVLIICLGLLQSCSTSKRIPLNVETFYVEYGDPRWNDCKNVYTQEYCVNIYGDTLPTRRIYSIDCYEGKMKTFADKTMGF